jgi:hypothetical protein
MRNVYLLVFVILMVSGYREDTHQKVTLSSEMSFLRSGEDKNANRTTTDTYG